jgi:molecular chaperone DnaK
MKFSAYFPVLDHTEELEIPIKAIEAPEANELSKKISNAKSRANHVNASDITERLETLENQLENEKGNADGRMKITDGLRKELLQLETLERSQEWPQIEQELKDVYFEFEDLVRKIKLHGNTDNLNMGNIDNLLADIKKKVDAVIHEKNRGEAKELIGEIGSLDFNLRNTVTGNAMDVKYLQFLNTSFRDFHWKDAVKARQLINKGLQMVANGNNDVRPVLVEIVQLMPKSEIPTNTLG